MNLGKLSNSMSLINKLYLSWSVISSWLISPGNYKSLDGGWQGWFLDEPRPLVLHWINDATPFYLCWRQPINELVCKLSPVSIQGMHFQIWGFHLIKTRQSWGRLVFITGTLLLARRHICTETASGPFSICGWVRSHPSRENATYEQPTIIG